MTIFIYVKADQVFAIDTAANAIKAQDKGEQARYYKDIAEMVKRELDTQRGYVGRANPV